MFQPHIAGLLPKPWLVLGAVPTINRLPKIYFGIEVYTFILDLLKIITENLFIQFNMNMENFSISKFSASYFVQLKLKRAY